MISIFEKSTRNSGIIGGKFLEKTRVPKPGSSVENPEYFGPADFSIGATVEGIDQWHHILGIITLLFSHAVLFLSLQCLAIGLSWWMLTVTCWVIWSHCPITSLNTLSLHWDRSLGSVKPQTRRNNMKVKKLCLVVVYATYSHKNKGSLLKYI